MKILLTGATGFVGSHVAEELMRRGHEVYALVRKSSRYDFLSQMGVKLIFGDLFDSSQKTTFPQDIQSVIHVAGLIKARSTDDFYRINTQGTRWLLEQFRFHSLQNFILVSSISARGPNKNLEDEIGVGPVSHYGKSKLEAEKLALEFRKYFPIIIFRPPIVYGPRDRETITLFKMFRRGLVFGTGGPERYHSFIFVDDLAETLAMAAEQGNQLHPGPFYPEDGHGGYSWNEMLGIAEKIYSRKIRSVPLPHWFGRGFVEVNELAGQVFGFVPLLNRDKFQEIKFPLWICSGDSLRNSYRLPLFTNLDDGFKSVKLWYEKEGWL